MKTSTFFRKIAYLFTYLILFMSSHAFADRRWDNAVVDLIYRAHDHSDNVEERIDYLTTIFVNKQGPYLLEPLGEGKAALFNQKPLYRLDGFDCTTFVETILALATTELSKNQNKKTTLRNFQKKINDIRYKNGEVSFYTRNHFISADWIPNNVAAGHVKDISHEIATRIGAPLTLPVLINKKSWYKHLTLDRICIKGDDVQQYPNCSAPLEIRESRLSQLQTTGSENVDNIVITLDYVPFTHLYPEGPNAGSVLGQIPHGAILQLVKPRYHLTPLIGTLVYISHQGIVIHKDGQVWFRHASSMHGKVVEELLSDYFNRYRDSSWCYKKQNSCLRGLNILMPVQ